MNDSTMDRSQGSPNLNATLGVPPYETPKNPQFPRLSELPVCPTSRMSPDNPIDKMSLEKTSPRPDPEEQVEKDIKPLITDTNERLAFSLNQSRHQRAVQQELRALLEHEKKILVQVAERATKFSVMKEENKKKIDDWEADHKQRMSFYSQFLKDLMEFPEDHCLTQDGVPTTVAQKILYSIVEKTGNIANNAIVQLSMQNTLVNDIDLSLGKLRQFCAVMIKQIDVWLKSLSIQSEHQERIVDLWEAIKQKIKSLKEMKDEEINEKNAPAGKLQTLEARVSKLENAVGIQEGDPTRPPTSPPSPVNPSPLHSSPESQQQKRPQDCPPCPPCSPYPTGKEYFGSIYSPPSPRPQQQQCPTASPTYYENRTPRTIAPAGQFPIDIVDAPGMFPMPRAAIEKEGRHRGQPIPLTPPSPCPAQYGAFNPQAGSSPLGSIRGPQDYYSQPTHPQMGQPLDSALIPKIQDDLQRLSRRNKKLEELVGNFRQMRALLTDEMDKAVKLNQKLQRDLYYVAQEADKQPQ